MNCTSVTLTERSCTIHSHEFPLRHRAAWRALLEWCEFHGIPIAGVPLLGTLTRHPEACAVEYTHMLRDSQGFRSYDNSDPTGLATEQLRAQGETPPLPWPAELQQLCWGAVQHDGDRGRPDLRVVRP